MDFFEAINQSKQKNLVTRECYINRKDMNDYYFVYIGEEIYPIPPRIRAQSFDGLRITSDSNANFSTYDVLAKDWIIYELKYKRKYFKKRTIKIKGKLND